MALGNQLGPRVLNLVEAWTPEKAYRSENKFRDDLKEYLETNLNDKRGGVMGQNRTHSLRKERGKSRADIAIDDEVGIELKREIKDSKLRRLRDQINDYQKEYDYVVVCACGVQETGKWNELRQDFDGQGGMGLGMGQMTTIQFVEKRKDGRTFRDSSGGAGGGLLGGGSLFDAPR